MKEDAFPIGWYRRVAEFRWIIAIVFGGIAIAAFSIVAPPVAVGLLFFVLLVEVAIINRQRQPELFLVSLGMLLTGYAFLGKGAAYIGIPPLYVGEVVLAIGVVTVAVSGNLRVIKRSPVVWLIVVFVFWSAAATVPYLTRYKIDALRDGAFWGYAVFAVTVSVCLLKTGWLPRFAGAYGKLLPMFLIWVPLITSLYSSPGRSFIPNLPISGMPLIHYKAGDICVHLAGAAAFILLGVDSAGGKRGFRGLTGWMLWTLWIASAAVNSAKNRGGMLAIIAALMVVAVVDRGWGWVKLILLTVFALGIFALADIGIAVRGVDVSVDQLISNTKSIVFNDPEFGNLQGTKEWRIMWWEKIIDYTVFGPYFWTGKGYGINLAMDDGFSSSAGKLRSPHNGHMTVLARSGVPGVLLWISIQSAFILGLMKAGRNARRTGNDGLARLITWIIAYWAAFMVNGAFDVYLESPQGGIWFWSLMGMGIAVIELSRVTFERKRSVVVHAKSWSAPRSWSVRER